MLPHDVGEEVKILKRLDHSNVSSPDQSHSNRQEQLKFHVFKQLQIVKLVDYHYETDLLEHYLHFPLFACTLTELFKDPSFPFEPPAVPLPQPSPLASFNVTTGLSYQLLTALGYLASSDVAHRDINPSNLLIDFCGNLKLVDFGTAWSGSSAVMMDNQGETVVRHDRSANGREQSQGDGEGVRARSSCDVGTGAYRAPELLFSPVKYNPYAVDSWAAGCVIAQMFRPFGSFDPHEFDDSGSDSDSDIRSDSEEGSDGWSDNTEDPDPLDEPWRRVRNSGGDGNGTGSRTGTTTGGDKGGMGERQPMFDASFGTLGLAASIFKIRGTPSLDTWPVSLVSSVDFNVSSHLNAVPCGTEAHHLIQQTFIQLPDAGKIGFPSSHPIPLTSPLILPHLQEGHDELMAAASKVIEGLLTLDPGRRLTAKKALESRWFEGVDNVLVQGVCRPWVGRREEEFGTQDSECLVAIYNCHSRYSLAGYNDSHDSSI